MHLYDGRIIVICIESWIILYSISFFGGQFSSSWLDCWRVLTWKMMSGTRANMNLTWISGPRTRDFFRGEAWPVPFQRGVRGLPVAGHWRSGTWMRRMPLNSPAAGPVWSSAVDQLISRWSVVDQRPLHRGEQVSHKYGYGSIPINTIFSGMNIHLPNILMFTRGTRFWPTAIWPHSSDWKTDWN